MADIPFSVSQKEVLHFTIKTESGKYHHLRHFRNNCTIIQLHRKPLLLCNFYRLLFLQTLSNVCYASPAVFTDEETHFSLLLYCFLCIITVIFTFYGRKNKRFPCGMWYFLFCCEARTLRGGFYIFVIRFSEIL